MSDPDKLSLGLPVPLPLGSTRKLLIGVVHLRALPGAPRYAGAMESVLCAARADARSWCDGGADALIVENFGDVPFHGAALPAESIAALALCLAAVRAESGERPLGVNALRNDARAAVGLCAATGASFLRVNVHTGAAATDQGLIEGRAAETLRERERLAPAAQILADVHVKHATPLGSESLEQAAEDAVKRGLADGLILSGTGTGRPTATDDLRRLRAYLPDVPLFVGSGTTASGAADLLEWADGAIVGTWAKRSGSVGEAVDVERVGALRRAFDGA